MCLPATDTRRQKRCGVLHFGFKETRKKPNKRSYENYIARGTEAIVLNKACDGVKGIWKFHRLNYASDIARTVDAMHAQNNVVCDFLASMRPTNSGDKQLFQHKNRTTNEKVVSACHAEGIPNITNYVIIRHY